MTVINCFDCNLLTLADQTQVKSTNHHQVQVKMIQQKNYICSVADCGKPGVGRCSQCKVRYCGEDCQADDWPSHMRFCLPLPPLEYPDPDQAAGLQIIDINNSTSSGNTIIAGSVSVEVNQPAGDQPTTGTKKEGGTDGKAKQTEEKNNNPPAQVEEVPKLPEEAVAVQPIPDVGDGSPKVEERKDQPKVVVEDSSSVKKVKEVITSTQMATQEVSAGLQDMDPLEAHQIVSPAEISISLAAEVKLCLIFAVSFHH